MEDKEYLTLAEASEEIGIKRASIYYYLKQLDIETYQFPNNKHTYILKQDVAKIKAVKKTPWKVSEGVRPRRKKTIKEVA